MEKNQDEFTSYLVLLKMTKLFPTTLIILDFMASFVYLYHGDYRHTIYWMAAGILTITVTF